MNEQRQQECKRHGVTTHVQSADGRFRCQACRVLYVRTRRKKVKAELVAHLGGHCVLCGYDRYIEALDFHHRDPAEKDFELSNKFHWSLVRLKAEADKCDLLCANCHREEHVRLGDY